MDTKTPVMGRPRLTLKLSTLDIIVEIIGLSGLIFLIFLPVYYSSDLLNEFLVSYMNNVIIWILPLVGLILYIGMTILNKYPHVFNYPNQVTNENAERLYKIGTKSIRFLKTIIVLFFAYLNFNLVETRLGEYNGILRLFIPFFLILIFATILIMIWEMKKNKA